MSKTKKYIEIVPTLTIITDVNKYDEIVWVGNIRFTLVHNMRHGLWSFTHDPTQSQLKKLGLNFQDYEEIEEFVRSLNFYSRGRNTMNSTNKENLIEDTKGYLEEVKEILKFSKYEEVITFDPISRLEEK